MFPHFIYIRISPSESVPAGEIRAEVIATLAVWPIKFTTA